MPNIAGTRRGCRSVRGKPEWQGEEAVFVNFLTPSGDAAI